MAFDSVPDEQRGTSEVTYWSDVPPATKDYFAARDVIVRHIDTLVPTLVSTRPINPTSSRASTNERIISASAFRRGQQGQTTEDFKVQDGLVFDAVRFGDAVKFTVETIKNVKTITALTKE